MGGAPLMPWSADFKIALSREQLYPRYVIEWVQIPAGTMRVFGGNLRLASFFVGPGYGQIADGSNFDGGRLTPRSWLSQPGSFTISFDGDTPEGQDFRRWAQRGQALRLRVGLRQDDGTYVYEPVLITSLVNLTLSNGRWSIVTRGLEGALNSRLTTTAGEQLLCHDLASTAVNNVAGYPGGATLTVDSTTGFRDDGSGAGVVKVTAASGTEYFVKYTGKTGTTFTGCTTSHFDTVFAATSDNAAVSEVAWTSAHPLEVVKRILTSTGDGTNGPDDILPRSWGFGIAADLVDVRDIQIFIDATLPTAGSSAWDWVVTAAVDDAAALLSAWLNGAGYFLTQHQGCITARAAMLPWSTPTVFAITDDLIAEIVSYHQWGTDAESLPEYLRSEVQYADASRAGISAASEVDHHPAADIKSHVAGGLYASNANEAAITTELVGRLKHWDIRAAEIFTLRLRGWQAGIVSCGDAVPFTTDRILSRDGLPFAGRKALVLRSSPAYFGEDSDVMIAVLPADETVPWRVP